jgi:hypothetical protein
VLRRLLLWCQAKARVQCWRDRHSADTFESPARLQDRQGGGFILQCAGHCDSLMIESTNRRLRCQSYPAVRAQVICTQEQQQQQHHSQKLAQHSSGTLQDDSSRRRESSCNVQALLSHLSSGRLSTEDIGQLPQPPLPDMNPMLHAGKPGSSRNATAATVIAAAIADVSTSFSLLAALESPSATAAVQIPSITSAWQTCCPPSSRRYSCL